MPYYVEDLRRDPNLENHPHDREGFRMCSCLGQMKPKPQLMTHVEASIIRIEFLRVCYIILMLGARRRVLFQVPNSMVNTPSCPSYGLLWGSRHDLETLN